MMDQNTKPSGRNSAWSYASAAYAVRATDKKLQAFFTIRSARVPKVEIFKSISSNPRAPLFSGTVGEKKVFLFLRKGVDGNFLSVVGDPLNDGSGNREDLGTANVVELFDLQLKLAIKFGPNKAARTTIFASISKSVSMDMLISIGFDLARQAEKRAQAAAAAAAAAAASADAK